MGRGIPCDFGRIYGRKGRIGGGKTKTALFCVIPDSDKTNNSIVGLLYSQIFQELYFQADFIYEGRLPIHVTFMLDEFAVRS